MALGILCDNADSNLRSHCPIQPLNYSHLKFFYFVSWEGFNQWDTVLFLVCFHLMPVNTVGFSDIIQYL